MAAESIKFGTCSLQSDKYICVCQGGELVIVDMTAGNAVKRWPISAEAAIMNPTQKIVALRGKQPGKEGRKEGKGDLSRDRQAGKKKEGRKGRLE